MSDGPYKSLPMSRAWKRIAEFAQNANFAPADIAEGACLALMRDWRTNVPVALIAGVKEVFCGSQSLLFAEQSVERLRAMENQTRNQAFARLFLDCAVQRMEAGNTGEAGLVQAAAETLLARGARGVRQVEEHFLRKSTPTLAKSVRSRLEQGVANADLGGCSRILLKLVRRPSRPSQIKHKGLDEGVPL